MQAPEGSLVMRGRVASLDDKVVRSKLRSRVLLVASHLSMTRSS